MSKKGNNVDDFHCINAPNFMHMNMQIGQNNINLNDDNIDVENKNLEE